MAIVRLQGDKEKKNGIYFEVDTSEPPIGEGGMGKVFVGKSVNTATGESRDVAIKFLFTDLPDQAIERARREARIQLRNDNLIEMLGFIETEEQRQERVVKHFHVVSELLHGVSLTDIISGKFADAKGNVIPYAKELAQLYRDRPDVFAKEIIKNVLSGLMALHDAGYIHRDIDPSNIMITADRHIKLIDFGICKQMKNLAAEAKTLTVAGAFMGKPEYAAPELALGDVANQNQTTDIYAVGILLYQCLTGKVPFEGTRFDVLDMQVKKPLDLKNITNKKLRDIIKKATEKRQEQRYQTAAEMRVDVESMDVKRAADPKKRMLMYIAGGAVVVALIVIGIIASYSSGKNTEVREQAVVDSLTNVVNTNVRQADELAAKGYAHDEEFDTHLVAAMALYKNADKAMAELKAHPEAQKPADYSAKKKQLTDALQSARAEIAAKMSLFEGQSDPDIVREGEKIKERVANIDKALAN